MLKLNLDEFENVLVYKSLTDEKYLSSIINHVDSKFFKDKNIKAIFEIIKGFYLKRNQIPTITEIRQYITTEDIKESFRAVLKSFSNIDKNFNDKELIENTERYIKEKAIFHTILEVAEDVGAGKIDTSFILDKFEKSCNISMGEDAGLDLFGEFGKVLEDINTAQPVIPSGWAWLDDKLGGGFQRNGKALYVFAGETNVGKSIFLGNIASNLAKGGSNVLIISLEMSELVYARRLASNLTKIPLRNLQTESANLKTQIDELAKNGAGKIFVKEFPPSSYPTAHLSAYVKMLKGKGIKIDAIVIDYLSLIKSTMDANSYERVKEVTEQVRAMSYIFSCPIISAAQLNRSGYGQADPKLNTMAESIGTPMTADAVIGIAQDENDKELGVIKINMMKNRFGPNFGTNAMRICYKTLDITEDKTLNDEGEQADISDTLQKLSKQD